MVPRVLAAALALVAVSALAAPGAAAQGRRSPPDEAVERYRAAYEHYESGRYDEAIAELEAALRLDPESPTLIYNLARVSELVGDLDRALEMQRAYLERLPRGERRERRQTERAIRRLEGAIEAREAQRPAPTTRPLEVAFRDDPVYVRERGVADAAFWTTGVGGVALVGAGAVLGVLALERAAEADEFVLGVDGTPAGRAALSDEARRLALAADVTLAVGGAAILGAILLYALRERVVERLPVEPFALTGRDRWLVGLRGSLP